jgi:hypothetical protein
MDAADPLDHDRFRRRGTPPRRAHAVAGAAVRGADGRDPAVCARVGAAA